MGGGSWTARDWSSFSNSRVSGRSTASIYTASKMKNDYDPKNVMRESCDSTEHPNSTPIILGLDVTGSMSNILQVMAEKLGLVMTEVYNRKPVTDPQILFAAVGDAVYDDYPLQVTQFESDIRIAKQLTEVYFERGGGGNGFESYPLIWYFAANHTKCDNYLKRNKKGFIFTFGDDGYPAKLTKREIKDIVIATTTEILMSLFLSLMKLLRSSNLPSFSSVPELQLPSAIFSFPSFLLFSFLLRISSSLGATLLKAQGVLHSPQL